MTEDFAQLKRLSELKFRQSEQSMAKLLKRETGLRSDLERLHRLAQETHSQPPAQAELRAIGGDIIWLKWLSEARRRLNIELAQVLAQKETMIAHHRKTNGEKLVSEAIFERQLANAKNRKARCALDEAIDATMTSTAFNNPDGQCQ